MKISQEDLGPAKLLQQMLKNHSVFLIFPSSIDTSLIRDIYCGSEVLFETCIAMKFVDDDDDDDDDFPVH